MTTRSIRDRVAGWARVAVPALAVLVFGASRASADFLQSGTTHMGGTTSAVMAFAVYDTTGGTVSDPYNMGANNPFGGSNPLPSWMAQGTGSTYLYLYGILNDPSASPITQAGVTIIAPVTSYGGTSVGFNTGSGSLFSTAGPAQSGAPVVINGSAPGYFVDASLPSGTVSALTGFGLSVSYSGIPGGGESSVFGFTSPFSPVVVPANVAGFGYSATGHVLAGDIVPEPSTVVMAAMAIPAGLIYVLRRRRAQTV